MEKPAGFNKKAYRQRAFVLVVLLTMGTVYFQEWMNGVGDLIRPTAAISAALVLILVSKWKRLLVILTLQVLGALALVGGIRLLATGKSITIAVIVLGISMGGLILIRPEREEKWLSPSDSSTGERIQALGLSETNNSDGKE